MKIYVENYSGTNGELYVDGAQYVIPIGRHMITLDTNMMMNGQATVMWDPMGMSSTDFMDGEDILTVDHMNNGVFLAVEEVAPSGSGTLIPKEVFFEGFVLGGVIAATMMMFVMLKKVLMQGPTYD